jgi:phosphatidylserine decarboxylase
VRANSLIRPDFHLLVALLSANVAIWFAVEGSLKLWLGVPALMLLASLLNFYRNPDRVLPVVRGVVAVSPADGRVVDVTQTEEGTYISIFLSALDVHVNRVPVSGTVVALRHRDGKYLPAFLSRSSSENERVILEIDSPEAGRVECMQVAGLLARRIHNWVRVGDSVRMGDRYGMIRLGSRVDLKLPSQFKPLVIQGIQVRGGETLLAEIPVG